MEAVKFDNPVVEGVYNSVKRRKELLEICKDKDPKICIWIDTSPEICMSRPHNLRINWRGHINALEPPTLEEGWDRIYIIK